MSQTIHLDVEPTACPHTGTLTDVTPEGDGCAACRATGAYWVHLRLCMSCGHVGCCDASPGRHASAHHETSGHPVIRSFQPGEGWGYCYPDDRLLRSRS